MTRITHVAEQDDADRGPVFRDNVIYSFDLEHDGASNFYSASFTTRRPKRDWTGVWLVLACVAICAGWLALGFYLGRRI